MSWVRPIQLAVAAALVGGLLLLDGTAQTIFVVALIAVVIVASEIVDRRRDADSGREDLGTREWLAIAAVTLIVFAVVDSHDIELIAVVLLAPLAVWVTRAANRRIGAADR